MTTGDLVKISKALADPTRLRIYEMIASKHDTFCGEIVEKFELSPATVSHHLKVLADADLIEMRREGQFIYNAPTVGTMDDYTQALARLVRAGAQAGKRYPRIGRWLKP